MGSLESMPVAPIDQARARPDPLTAIQDTHQGFFPPGVACGAKGGTADFRTTTSGAAPTSPPEGVFRHILLRKKYRRAFGTHYGPTLTHQACYSPRHGRDGRVQVGQWHYYTLLSLHLPPYLGNPATTSGDYGPEAAAGAWAPKGFEGDTQERHLGHK